MLESSQSETVQNAIAAVDRGDTLHGLITLECSPGLRGIPVVNSYLAYCIAKERGQVREAVHLCGSALAAEPRNPAHHLNLGRILLLAGQKANAIAAFRKGLSSGSSADMNVAAESPRDGQARQQALILGELRRLGFRKRAPFPSILREHPLNRVVGKLLSTVHLR
ncbi:MAG TPA: tetratricopeptide repeat protein [Vicinamibacterales bacterium]